MSTDLTESFTSSLVQGRYDEILSKMQDGTLYGVPIDIHNQKVLVVAAYCLGQYETSWYGSSMSKEVK